MKPRLGSVALLVAAMCACKGDPGPRKAPNTPAKADDAAPAGPAYDAGPDLAMWRARPEAIPGETVLTWVNGPRRFGDEIWIGSSVIGVVSLEPDSGLLISQERESGPFLKAPEDPDTVGVVRVAGESVTVTRTAIERAGGWRYAFADRADLGVSGPIVIGGVAVAVVDETLVGIDWATGAEKWRAEGRYSPVTGGLRAGAGGIVRAIALDGGIRPVAIDPATGSVTHGGHRAPGLHALAADWMPAGQLGVVVRRDGTMLRDALAVFDADGGLLYQWELPRPDAARVDPVGVFADGDGFVLFYDGRYAAKFAAAAPAAP